MNPIHAGTAGANSSGNILILRKGRKTMSNIIAIALEKGGVGKTTTALNIGAGLAQLGQNVLLVDLDQQCHLSRWLEFQPDGKPAISELIYQEVSGVHSNQYGDFIRRNDKENVDYIPASKMLGGIYAILGNDGESNTVLSRIFRNDYFSKYDYILFDCPTAVDNLLVSNALQASTKLLMPVQAELLAYESVPAMLKRYMAIKKAENITSYIQGILVTMFSGRTNMSNQVYQRLCESYHGLVFSQPIPMLQEARNSTETRSSLISRKSSKIGQAYMAAVREIIRRDSK
ncbi:MAG TPA: hypothetical protein DD429_08125 [Clostridiaceae bacterium]|jgi:chromosome partitioning protein|nr:hypothetical protein [Clostridiaceae bacterium]